MSEKHRHYTNDYLAKALPETKPIIETTQEQSNALVEWFKTSDKMIKALENAFADLKEKRPEVTIFDKIDGSVDVKIDRGEWLL